MFEGKTYFEGEKETVHSNTGDCILFECKVRTWLIACSFPVMSLYPVIKAVKIILTMASCLFKFTVTWELLYQL